MGQVFAGFVCGYILALAGAPLLAIWLTRARLTSPLLQRLAPPGTNVVAFVAVLHGGLVVVCTGTGLLLGLLLYVMRDDGEALGSPNIAFTLFVAGLTLMLFAPVVALAARVRRQALVAAVLILLLFGWLMPYMAQWSTFGSS
jgi:hypothetical protein